MQLIIAGDEKALLIALPVYAELFENLQLAIVGLLFALVMPPPLVIDALPPVIVKPSSMASHVK